MALEGIPGLTEKGAAEMEKVRSFSLKWSRLVIKENINLKFQKFICKPQLAYKLWLSMWMLSLTSRKFNHSKRTP